MTHTTANSGTVEHIDPTTLVIEANVRPSAPLTPAFVDSIRENGVLTPVLARRDDKGNVLVRAGQRRTLASREAGLPTIPVYIVSADEATAERIIQQMVENDQREALSDGDRAAAFQQLAFEGLTVAAIAKRTGTKAAEVKTAIAVAENPAAASAIHEYAITLDQAAALIEFEDSPELRDDLIEIASTEPTQFAHATQRARDQRERDQKQAAAEADLLERGYEVLDSEPDYHSREIVSLNYLATADGKRVTVEQIEALDGRAALVRLYYNGDPVIRYYLRDPEAAGFTNTDRNTGANSGPMTDEQKEERRTLIANNKAWDSAETVRRAWLTTLLSRKTLPKDTATVIAAGLTIHRHAISRFTGEGNVLAHSLLGIDRGPGWGSDHLATLTASTPPRPPSPPAPRQGHPRRARHRPRSHREQHQPRHLAQPHRRQPRLLRPTRRLGIRPQRRREDPHHRALTGTEEGESPPPPPGPASRPRRGGRTPSHSPDQEPHPRSCAARANGPAYGRTAPPCRAVVSP